jgi:hypothetical protein
MSVHKTKAMAMKGKMIVRTKIVINNHIFEQVNSFNYFGYTIKVINNRDLEIKMNRFNQTCSTVRRTPNNKARKDTQEKFCEVIAIPILTYRSEIWTITKNMKQKLKLQKLHFL